MEKKQKKTLFTIAMHDGMYELQGFLVTENVILLLDNCELTLEEEKKMKVNSISDFMDYFLILFLN